MVFIVQPKASEIPSELSRENKISSHVKIIVAMVTYKMAPFAAKVKWYGISKMLI